VKRTYVYRVELLSEPIDDIQQWPGGRSNYLSRSAAVHRVQVLNDHGIKAKVVRSEPVEFLAPVIPLRSAS
jgi:hypothetical protein